jgi:hypothetical protein
MDVLCCIWGVIWCKLKVCVCSFLCLYSVLRLRGRFLSISWYSQAIRRAAKLLDMVCVCVCVRARGQRQNVGAGFVAASSPGNCLKCLIEVSDCKSST